MATAEMKVSAIVPWFGSSRMIGHYVGKALEGCTHVTVPFLGGGCELARIKARTLVCNDLHRAVINLSTVLSDTFMGPKLIRRLKRWSHHAGIFSEAQGWCSAADATQPVIPSFEWAEKYFIACWMGRNGEAGKSTELDAGFSVRYDAGGGDSAVRYRNAVKSLIAWRRVLARATFVCMDAFDLLAKVKDERGAGLYCDPPWPLDGRNYKHSFTDDQQMRLAKLLVSYRKARVVVRYGDCAMIRALYDERNWQWQEIDGRTSGNKTKHEVLIVNRSSLDDSDEAARLF